MKLVSGFVGLVTGSRRMRMMPCSRSLEAFRTDLEVIEGP